MPRTQMASTLRRQVLRPTNILLLLLGTIVFLSALGTKAAERDAAAAASNLRASGDTKKSGGGSGGGSSAVASDPNEEAPLVAAIRAQRINKVESLLKEAERAGATTFSHTVNHQDDKGITPLIEATLAGNQDLVQLLLNAGAPAQPPPGFQHTPLRAACLTGNVPLIELLLAAGADPNAKSEGDRTPLMGACFLRPEYDANDGAAEKSLSAVRAMLRDDRTDLTVANSFGETALDLCKQRKYEESVKELEEAIAAKKAQGEGGLKR